MRYFARLLLVPILLCVVTPVRAQEPPTEPKQEERSLGLPGPVDWVFNFDASWGTFGFGNSLYTDPKEGVPENMSDQWFEGAIKPGLTGSHTFSTTSVLYGKVSGVGERTYGSAPSLAGSDFSSFQVEDLAIGWRSGKQFENLGPDSLEFVVGRAPFKLGHGFLVYDGAAEGGTRGGYWTNARKAFQFAAVGRFKPGFHTIETFYLDKDELPENDTGTRLWGANYEFNFKGSTFGATYMKFWAHQDLAPGRDGLNVFNARAYTAPILRVPQLTADFEYASERNGDALHSDAWYLQGAYEFDKVTWKPKFSYRYAYFKGDDPNTKANEAFDPLLLGFYDWGTWWQGEIAGEYFIVNSNVKSHQYRVHVTPNDKLGGGLIFYDFNLDQMKTFQGGVTNDHVAFEMDAYTDWKVNKNITLSFVGAFSDPGGAVQQAFNRTKNFVYGMIFVAYAY